MHLPGVGLHVDTTAHFSSCGLFSGERPFECRICKMAFTTNGNMHRHTRIHEKELAGSTGIVADLDSPRSTTTSPGSHSPRGRKRPIPRANGDSGGCPRNLYDDVKGVRRKLAAVSPMKKSCDGAVDLCKNKTEACADEPVSASSSDQVGLTCICFFTAAAAVWNKISKSVHSLPNGMFFFSRSRRHASFPVLMLLAYLYCYRF